MVEADEARARERFVARNGTSIEVFEAQMKRIRNNRSKIEELFHPNLLTTLRPNNTCLTFREIFDAVRGVPNAPERRLSLHF